MTGEPVRNAEFQAALRPTESESECSYYHDTGVILLYTTVMKTLKKNISLTDRALRSPVALSKQTRMCVCVFPKSHILKWSILL